jgi:integrase/recombinase XerD
MCNPQGVTRRCTLSSKEPPNKLWHSQLGEHLRKGRYSPYTTRCRIAVATRFVSYLNKRQVALEAVEPSGVDRYLREELRLFRHHHRRAPRSMDRWRHEQTAGIYMLLRLVRKQWPPSLVGTPSEQFHRQVCEQYAEWMADIRGLALETRSRRCSEAHQFLSWLEERGNQQNLLNITIRDVDSYLMVRAASQRRTSVKLHATRLRSFLRFLYISGHIILDLSSVVIGPRLYAFESVPSALRSDDVSKVLETARKDLSQKGLRDYAILILLSRYGLRAAEVTTLRMSDVDWKRDVLRIQHSKNGGPSELPLLPTVGDAILDYLRKGRPKTDAREIFVRHRAPYRHYPNGSSLYRLVRNRITAAGIEPQGRLGSHAFRHARAVSMLRAAVPIKEIGDLLGHRSAHATAAYLKLATEDLRVVALELPAKVVEL